MRGLSVALTSQLPGPLGVARKRSERKPPSSRRLPRSPNYRVTMLPHTPRVPPPPHVSGDTHMPHWIKSPQPSPAGPQLMPWSWQVIGTHAPGGVPHWPKTPPPPHV